MKDRVEITRERVLALCDDPSVHMGLAQVRLDALIHAAERRGAEIGLRWAREEWVVSAGTLEVDDFVREGLDALYPNDPEQA